MVSKQQLLRQQQQQHPRLRHQQPSPSWWTSFFPSSSSKTSSLSSSSSSSITKKKAVVTCSLIIVAVVVVFIFVVGYAMLALQHSFLFDPTAKLVRQRRNENSKPYRIFVPLVNNNENEEEIQRVVRANQAAANSNKLISFEFYTREQQREFLSDFGTFCERGINNNNSYNKKVVNDNKENNGNLLVHQFDHLPASYGVELWKYCVLYTGIANTYWEGNDNVKPLVSWDDLLLSTESTQTTNIAIQLERATTTDYSRIITTAGEEYEDEEEEEEDKKNVLRLSHSFLRIAKPKSKVCANMMRVLMSTTTHATSTSTPPDPVRLSELLGLYVENDQHKQEWQFWSAKCVWNGPEQHGNLDDSTTAGRRHHPSSSSSTSTILLFPPSSLATARRKLSMQHQRCPMAHSGHCCQVWLPEAPDTRWAALVIRDPYLRLTSSSSSSDNDEEEGSAVQQEEESRVHHRPFVDTTDETKLGLPASEIPYIATIREVPIPVHHHDDKDDDKSSTSPISSHGATPNFFDILVENHCLPEGRECFRCLKKPSSSTSTSTAQRDEVVEETNDCVRCQKECPCYCRTLCHVRPPPKRIAAEWLVRLPPLRRDPSRLVPRLIHQTWYEPITKEKYPNMSRLIESFRSSGWVYQFWDDNDAAEFLSTHFPPQVREAYDSILPGAFKADLFRYCVLLIRGGVYADMDIMLQSNLDLVLNDDIGFLTAQDEPGEHLGHRSCLWNGLMASTPGHPFLMRTIEYVVNNIRNRFTSVDYDDMLCPNPVLSVSHTSDMLFTCGPCILGASINDVLKRHKQTSFEYGDIDLFETEKRQQQQQESGGESDIVSGTTTTSVIDPDDPRLLIPGRSILLRQNKDDMGAHRFSFNEKNIVVASTDLPDSDDRPKSLVHYSKAREKFGIYGFTKLYNDTVAGSTLQQRANEEIRIRIE